MSTRKIPTKQHMSKARAVDSSAVKIANANAPGQLLNTQLSKIQTSNKGFNSAALNYGHFVRPDKRDTDIQVKQELAQLTGFGVPSIDSEDVNWYKQKKAQEEQVASLSLASLLIDPDHPSSQADVYRKFPQLKEYPDELFHQQLAIQEALRNIIRDGTVNGQEDLDLIRYILREDTVLPMLPLWDPTGLIVGPATGSLGSLTQHENAASYLRGFFNPRSWAVDPTKITDAQRAMKEQILRRCFPAVKGLPATDFKTLFDSVSKKEDFTGTAITNNIDRFYLKGQRAPNPVPAIIPKPEQ